MDKKPYAVALADMDLIRLESSLRALEASALVAELHNDIADGVFAPGYGVGEALLGPLRAATTLPLHVHLAATQVDRQIPRLIAAGAQHITVHAEACTHLHRTLSQIRDLGASPGVALLPATPMTRLEYALGMVDRVLLLAADPMGTQSAMAIAYERVRILKENLRYLKNAAVLEVEGGLDVEASARMLSLGADRVVLDRSNVFQTLRKSETRPELAEALQQFHRAVGNAQHLV